MTALTEADWGRIFAKSWTDENFRQAYEKDPRAAIKAHAESLNVDPDADFSFPAMPNHADPEKLKAIAEGSIDPEPMYCC